MNELNTVLSPLTLLQNQVLSLNESGFFTGCYFHTMPGTRINVKAGRALKLELLHMQVHVELNSNLNCLS